MTEQKLIRTEKEAIECLKKNKPTSGFYMLQEAVDMAICSLEEIQQYKALGTVEELRVARDKQIPKKPKYQKIEYGKHKWKRKENGEIDDFAWEYEYCNGVVCEICGLTQCVHCNPDYDELEDCEVENHFCPNCNENVGYRNSHCKKCNQKLDWEEV